MTRANCIVARCGRPVVDPAECPEYPEERCRNHGEELLKAQSQRPQSRFAMVGSDLLFDRTLDDVCFRMLVTLDRRQFRQGRDKSKPIEGLTRLARIMGKDHSTISKHLVHLEAGGWVTVERINRSSVRISLVQNGARGLWSSRWLELHPEYADPTFDPEKAEAFGRPPQNTTTASVAPSNHEPVTDVEGKSHELGAQANEFVAGCVATEPGDVIESSSPVTATDHELPQDGCLSSHVSGTSFHGASDEESHWDAILRDGTGADPEEERLLEGARTAAHPTPADNRGGARRRTRLGEMATTRRRGNLGAGEAADAVGRLAAAFGPGTRVIDANDAQRLYRHRGVPVVPDEWHSGG